MNKTATNSLIVFTGNISNIENFLNFYLLIPLHNNNQMKMHLILISLISIFSCNIDSIIEEMEDPIEAKTLKYLAIGDSYTIGESVGKNERFPAQLFNTNFEVAVNKGAYKIIATTGWTTRNLLDAMDEENLQPGTYNFITLLIGVNNQYQKKPFSQYQTELNELMDRAITLLNGKAKNLIVVSIPDYSVTPFASSGNTSKIAEEIKRYNDFKEEMTKSKGAKYVYITDLTQNAKYDPSLLADDKLHPSGQSYEQWVERILPELNVILKQ